MELSSIAFIPDGNRRFAKIAGISLAESYALGTKKAWKVMEWLESYPKITVGTFWALSNENLQRTSVELELLFKIFEKELERVKKTDFFERSEVKINFVGRLNALPKKIQKKIFEVEKLTENFAKRTVNIAIGYGGRAEIVDAAKKVALDYKQNRIDINSLDEEKFRSYLYNPSYPDLIIRTSGTKRLSGFLPFQSAYSELYFCSKYWPDFSQQDLAAAIKEYSQRDRKYGK